MIEKKVREVTKLKTTLPDATQPPQRLSGRNSRWIARDSAAVGGKAASRCEWEVIKIKVTSKRVPLRFPQPSQPPILISPRSSHTGGARVPRLAARLAPAGVHHAQERLGQSAWQGETGTLSR